MKNRIKENCICDLGGDPEGEDLEVYRSLVYEVDWDNSMVPS